MPLVVGVRRSFADRTYGVRQAAPNGR